MRRRWRVALNVVLVLALVGAGYGAYRLLWPSRSTPTAGSGREITASRTSVVETVSAAGSVASSYTASVDFGTSGTVTEVDVKLGDPVTVGQVLAKLDATQANKQVQVAAANLDAAQEDLDNAETAAATPTTTYPNGAQSPGSSSGGGQSITSLKAKVDQAELTLDQARDAVTATVLKAPGAGTVTTLTGAVGQRVGGSGTGSGSGSGSGGTGSTGSSGSATSSSFAVITNMTALVVKANVAEIDVSKVKAGQDVSVTVNAMPQTPIAGKVTQVDLTPTTSGNAVEFGVATALTAPPEGLRPGQSASVTITVAQADNAVAVPSAAVQTVGDTSTVTVLENGQQTRRTVQVGVRGESLIQITSGLDEGETVVLNTTTATGSTGNRGGSNFPGAGGGGIGGFPGTGGGTARTAGGGR